ncbi:MAG: rhodanese-like domain-containing protein [Pseudomonadota bacterium]
MAAFFTTCCENWPRKRIAAIRTRRFGASVIASGALALAACSGDNEHRERDDAAPAPSLIPQLASLQEAASYSNAESDRQTASVFVRGVDPMSFARDIQASDARVIDVRTPAEFAEGAIPDAENFPLDAFRPEDFRTADGKTLFLYCRSGRRSGQALARLELAGITGAVHLEGGILAWQRSGYAVKRP